MLNFRSYFEGGAQVKIFLMILLSLASIILIASILLQSGKSAGLSGAIGGGAEQHFGKKKSKGYGIKFFWKTSLLLPPTGGKKPAMSRVSLVLKDCLETLVYVQTHKT